MHSRKDLLNYKSHNFGQLMLSEGESESCQCALRWESDTDNPLLPKGSEMAEEDGAFCLQEARAAEGKVLLYSCPRPMVLPLLSTTNI